jgi:hypothetical protein
MTIPKAMLIPGAKLYDPNITTFPVHRRLYRAVEHPKDGRVRLIHIASGASRYTSVDAPGLELIPDVPDLAANLDCLVGDTVKLQLRSGSTITGYCTGIVYTTFKVNDCEYRQVQAIELDHSGSTTYPLTDIEECYPK